MNSGFHCSSATFLIDWAANFGVGMLMKTSTPFDFRATTCESMVGTLVSYGSSATIMVAAFLPRPSLMPLR